jgi:hypothetical protein
LFAQFLGIDVGHALGVTQEVEQTMAEGRVPIGGVQHGSKDVVINLAETFWAKHNIGDGFDEREELVVIGQAFDRPKDRSFVSVVWLFERMLDDCLCERRNGGADGGYCGKVAESAYQIPSEARERCSVRAVESDTGQDGDDRVKQHEYTENTADQGHDDLVDWDEEYHKASDCSYRQRPVANATLLRCAASGKSS